MGFWFGVGAPLCQFWWESTSWVQESFWNLGSPKDAHFPIRCLNGQWVTDVEIGENPSNAGPWDLRWRSGTREEGVLIKTDPAREGRHRRAIFSNTGVFFSLRSRACHPTDS